MVKATPTVGRILVMALFSLSCFGLLLFLWTAFGGAIPLKPQGYRVQVAFQEATQLGIEADVRISGITVGAVRDKQLERGTSSTLVTIELDRRYAPLAADARAKLREKTLLGETYVELTPGSADGPTVPEGGRLADGQVAPSVQLDEIFSALDAPTREAFGVWQRDFGRAVERRGGALNAALGTLPTVAGEATDLLEVLERNEEHTRSLVRDTGEVFEALGGRGERLRSLVTSAEEVFATTGARHNALADTVRILPTFLAETRATLARTERFAADTDPLVRELRPTLTALRPASEDLARFAPDLRALARRLDPLTRAAQDGLPATTQVLDGLGPVLGAVGPFLGEVNPILEWLEYNQRYTSGFFNASAGLNDTTDVADPDVRGNYLRSLSPTGLESVGVFTERLPTSRGNSYPGPAAYFGTRGARELILPSWDCANSGRGEFRTRTGGTNDAPSCWTQGFPGWPGAEPGRLPRIERADYTRP